MKKLSKNQIKIIMLVLSFLIVLGFFLLFFRSNRSDVGPCDESVVNQYNSSLSADNKENYQRNLKELSDKIKNQDEYASDINCQYILMIANTELGKFEEAKNNLKEVQSLESKGKAKSAELKESRPAEVWETYIESSLDQPMNEERFDTDA